MTTTVQRIVSSCFVLVVATAGLAIPAPAQAQYRQHQAAAPQFQSKIIENVHAHGSSHTAYDT